MIRFKLAFLALALVTVAPAFAQDPLESYFVGRQVVAKIDMPGTEKGIDLKFDKSSPMDWNDVSNKIRANGIAIHKGEMVRVTKFVVKKDIIEFQLNGGGFGVAGDDTNTVVLPVVLPKSDREKDLEKQLAAEKDNRRRDDIQHDLDRERRRRDDINARNASDAQMASQAKAQQVMQRRLTSGSRFNLRFPGQVPSDAHNPEAIMGYLAEYVDFNAKSGSAPAYVAPPPPPPAYSAQPAYAPQPSPGGGQVQRGMRIDQVTNMLGRGKVMSDTMTQDGLHSQEIIYASGGTLIDVNYVEGVVVRFSVNSN